MLLHEVLVPGLNLLPEEVVHHGAGEGADDGALHAQPGVDEVHGQLLRLGLVPEPVRHVGEHAQSAEDAGRQHRVLLGLAHQLVPPALHGEGDELPGGLAAVAAGHLADDAQWCAARHRLRVHLCPQLGGRRSYNSMRSVVRLSAMYPLSTVRLRPSLNSALFLCMDGRRSCSR